MMADQKTGARRASASASAGPESGDAEFRCGPGPRKECLSSLLHLLHLLRRPGLISLVLRSPVQRLCAALPPVSPASPATTTRSSPGLTTTDDRRHARTSFSATPCPRPRPCPSHPVTESCAAYCLVHVEGIPICAAASTIPAPARRLVLNLCPSQSQVQILRILLGISSG